MQQNDSIRSSNPSRVERVQKVFEQEVHMKTKYFVRRIGGFIMAAILLSGIAMFGGSAVQAQGRFHRRVIIVRPYRPYRWGFGPRWGYSPYGYDLRYSHYVFDNGDQAANQGYTDGYKTGQSDGKKSKSFSAERSHYFHDAGFGNFAEAYRLGFSRGYREGYDFGNSGAGR
jgi:hypothetical protein